jgi:L-alanine-DL-glutamate epimerase-like enolase superfamily enzyme
LAAFHLAAAHPSVLNVEFHMVHQVMFDQFPFSQDDIQGGLLRLPDKPGLGITLQYDKVEQVI